VRSSSREIILSAKQELDRHLDHAEQYLALTLYEAQHRAALATMAAARAQDTAARLGSLGDPGTS